MLYLFRTTFSSALAQLLLLLLCMSFGMAISSLIMHLFPAQTTPEVDVWWLRLQMAVNTLLWFVLPTMLAAVLTSRYPLVKLGMVRTPLLGSALNVAMLALASVPFISYAAEANAYFHLPEWAQSLEQMSAQLTGQVLYTQQWGVLLVNLVVIAVLPAVGEELFFRGFVQGLAHRATRNIHVGILITALLFSLIHLQFAGFIPRFLLGALFGYLYYWSRSIWLPIIAHLVNNATVVVVYFGMARAGISLDVLGNTDQVMGQDIGLALASLAVSVLIMWHVLQIERVVRLRVYKRGTRRGK